MGKSSNWLPAAVINSNYDDIEVFVAMEHLFATVHRLKTEVLTQAEFCTFVDQILGVCRTFRKMCRDEHILVPIGDSTRILGPFDVDEAPIIRVRAPRSPKSDRLLAEAQHLAQVAKR